MKRFFYLFALVATASLTACSGDDDGTTSTGSTTNSDDTTTTTTTATTTTSTSDSDSEYVNTDPTTIDFTNDYISNNFTAATTCTLTFDDSGNATLSGAQTGVSVAAQSGNYISLNLASEGIVLKLTGSTSSGCLLINSTNKFELNLSGVSITNPNGSAINIQNGHCFVVVDGTNTLADGSSAAYSDDYTSTAKSVFHSEDKLRFSGDGTLTVTANNASDKHAISSDDWLFVNGPTINVTAGSGAGHGFKVNDGFHLVSGNVTSTVSGAAKKGINSEAFVYVEGGTLTTSASGSYEYDSDDAEYKAAAGISADGYFTTTGGTVTSTCSGAGGKGINCNLVVNIKGGTVSATATGATTSDSVDKSPKGIKSDGDIIIQGGTTTAKSTKSEGIETKSAFTMTGGVVYSTSSDDAINSSGVMTLSGGYVGAVATDNDAIDANGNLYVNGATVYAISKAGGAEQALDANTEGGAQLYIQSGTLVAYPSLENGASISISCNTASLSTSKYYSFTNGSTGFAFKVPTSGTYIVASSDGKLYSVSTSGGTSIFNGYGLADATLSSASSISLGTYSSGSSMGGFSSPNMGGGPGGH